MINSRYFVEGKVPSKPLYKLEHTLPPKILRGIFSHVPDFYASDLCQASTLNDLKVFCTLMQVGSPSNELLKKVHELAVEAKSKDILHLFEMAHERDGMINTKNLQRAICLKRQQEDTQYADREIQQILEEADSHIINEYQKAFNLQC